MEKILNLKGLGVSGRQNELIELALTFKFNTVEVDMEDLIGRHDTMGKEFACQFLQSAKINIGAFDLPIDLNASDEDYAGQAGKLDTVLSLCETLGGKRCRIRVSTSSDMPFRECFDKHQSRLNELGDKCAANGLILGLGLRQVSSNEKEHKFIHTAEELMTLVKTVGHSNVGLFLDTWHWKVADGSMDQISELEVDKITELAMADIPSSADPAKVTASNRILPGDETPSFSCDVFEALKAKGFDGPVSFTTSLSTFANTSRDRIVNRISKRLDCLIAGESFETIEEKTLAETVEEANKNDRDHDAITENGEAQESDNETNDSAASADAESKNAVAAAE